MVIDRIEEQARYYDLHPLMEPAFAFLAEAADLEPGRYDLEDGVYATISEFETRELSSVPLEAHRQYIDLQYCISGGERMSWAYVGELNREQEDPQRDIAFYTGNSTSISIRPGMFYILFPGDAHRSGCHHEFPKHCKKVVVKIPVHFL